MTSPTLAERLDLEPGAAARAAPGRLLRQAALPLLTCAALFAAWSALAPIGGAVVAPAQIKVELNRKTVMHAEGGIVREILVRDGQPVHAGQALLVVGDLRTDAALGLLQDQHRAARLRIARAEAESQLASAFTIPPDLLADPLAAEHIARERAAFIVRRRALDEQTTQLQRQVEQSQAQAAALSVQIASTARSAELAGEELVMNERLAEQGFVHRSRLIGLQRVGTDYAARQAEFQANLAASRQRSGEVRARIAALRLQAQTLATDELREAGAQLRQLEQQLRPGRDQAERQTVRASADGTVMGLRVAAAGTVVGPREPLLELVPSQEKLVFDARIAPQDIEHLAVGGAAEVKLLGSQARHARALPGRVSFVAPDRSVDETTGQAWFHATVEVDAATLRAAGAPELHAGMPAEVYVATSSRSLLQYLIGPLELFRARALREA